MSARRRMTMRAVIERDTATGTDDFGSPVKPLFTTLATVPCWAWSKQRRERVDGNKSALIEDLRAMFPLDADVLAGDEIVNITNRLGTVLIAGRIQIETMQRKHDHQEAGLERVA